jgi:parallel beta-helix repeat protein
MRTLGVVVLASSLIVAACTVGGQRSVTGDTRTPSVPAEVTEWVRPSIGLERPAGHLVAPGDDIQSVIESAGEGAVIILGAGVHRMQTIQPRRGQHIIGEPGATLNGALVLDEFLQENGRWVHHGITAEGEQRGTCAHERSPCRLPENLFIDDERLARVISLREVDEGTWYLDYETDTLYLGSDPRGRLVELSVLPFAIISEARDVTIEGLTIEKYATPAQHGAVTPGHGWRIHGNEIRWVHGTAIRAGTDLIVSDNYLHHNGQFAIAGGGNGSIYERNEIAFNHLGDFSFLWAAGGVKFVHSSGLLVRDNYVHDNLGPGLWIDGYNENITFENNRIFNNLDSGIKVEISGSTVIRGNVVVGNGFGNPNRWRGAGILIRESGPVEVVGNEVRENNESLILHHDANRNNDTGNHLHSIHVHDNVIALDGLVGYFGDIRFDAFATADIRFENNLYRGSSDARMFLDHGRAIDFERWQGRGRDRGSRVESG